MSELDAGMKAPDFRLVDQNGTEHNLTDFRGRFIVLYFYPKDNTSGCTLEAQDFTAFRSEFEAKNAVILGMSPDSAKSHKSFCEKKQLSITLLSDTGAEIAQAYGVWQKKKLYGKEYYGIVRSTFLITPDGDIVKVWRAVKVKDHVQKVLETLQNLQ